MTYPTAAVTTTNLDAGTDSPATARSDLLDALQKLNQMIAHTTAFAATLLGDANAAAARSTLGAAESGANTTITSLSGKAVSALALSGANTDITSLSAPALGAATATTQTSTDNSTKVATTAYVKAVQSALGFTSRFTSSEQTLTAGAALNIAHSLGAVPSLFRVVIRCKSAEQGYSVGDEVVIDNSFYSGNQSITVSADATNVNIVQTFGANFTVGHKSSTTAVNITLASWRYVVRAWA